MVKSLQGMHWDVYRTKMRLRSLLMLLLVIASLTSCKEMTQGKGLAETAIVDFHQQFNAGKFQAIYAAAHADLKSAASEDEFVKLLEAVHRKLGKQVKSTEGGWRVNSFNFKTVVLMSQNTEFENGKGTETFSFIISGESCLLQSYHIDSKDMLLK